MKKCIFTFALVMVASAIYAQTAPEVGGIYYLFNDNALTAKVTYAGWSPSDTKEYSGDVVIQPTVDYNNKTYKVVGIYDHAFDGCDGMTSITLPNSITSIGWSSFEGCTGLTSINIPDGVTKISAAAFSGCIGLQSVTFGTGLEQVMYSAFANCTAVKSVICKAVTPPTLVSGIAAATEENPASDPIPVFQNVDCSEIPVYVPAASVPRYYRADQWKDFKFIKAYDATTVVVEDVNAEPTTDGVTISWPAVDDAVAYIIEVRKGEELICSMKFNAEGELFAVKYAAPARNGNSRKLPSAVQTSDGWQYTIDGLEAETQYTYTMKALKSDNSVAYETSAEFTTTDGQTGVEEVIRDADGSSARKVLRDGQILILHDGKIYTPAGMEVANTPF